MRYLEGESTYILANFNTGDTVKITVYKLSDNSKVVDDVSMAEILSTGRFKYSFSQGVNEKTEYLWVADNTIEEQQGKIILGGYPDGIKDQTDKMNFTGDDIKATLDNEEVTTDTASRTASKATGFATSTELSSHDTKLDTVDGLVDRILKATEIKQCIINDASATTLSFTTNLTETSNQFWQRGVILITSGNNGGQIRAIKNYNGSTKTITLKTPLDTAPAQNDTFIILTERKYLTPDIEDIIGAVWDEPIASHTNVLNFGGKNQKVVPSETLADYKATGFNTTTPPTVTEIKTKMEESGSHLDFLKEIEGGKWHITGNQMIFTKADNVTEICRFNLFNSADNPAEINIYKRERV